MKYLHILNSLFNPKNLEIMPETINVSNVTISQIDSGENFQSPETPLAYASKVNNGSVNVTVIAPFHDNVLPSVTPEVTATVNEDGNNVSITPGYDPNVPLSNIYTQVVKISFALNGVDVDPGGAFINITVDEEGRPDNNPERLGEPKRKTKIVASGG